MSPYVGYFYGVTSASTLRHDIMETIPINLNALPFTFKASQKQGATFHANGTHINGANGNFQLDCRGNKIVFNSQAPNGGTTTLAYNLAYELQGAPSKNFQSIGNSGATTWTLASNFTAELN